MWYATGSLFDEAVRSRWRLDEAHHMTWLALTNYQTEETSVFINRDMRLRPDAEKIVERAVNLTDDEIGRLEERQWILRDVINSFEARLADVPERERKAILCLLYTEVAEKVFDFRLSLETRLARKQIASATSVDEKLANVATFQAIMADVAMLHGE